MPIGPAMLLAGLGALALATMGKKGGAAVAPPPGSPPGGGGSPSDPIVNTPAGPIPVALPKSFHDMLVKSLQDMNVADNGSFSGPVSPDAVQRATTVAAQLDAAGFGDAANALRAIIERAKTQVPKPAPDKQVPLPGVSPAITDMVNQAVQLERDPDKLQKVLDTVMKSAPPSPQRDALEEMLENAIKQAQAAIVLAATLKKTDDVLKSPGLPPASTVPTPVIDIPNMVVTAPGPSTTPSGPAPEIADTQSSRRAINLANYLRNLVADNGGDVKKAKGKEDKGLVSSFQRAENLTVDGKMGPTGTKTLAKYTGDLPLVFYWPTSATQKNVLKYRADLNDIADAHENAGRPLIAAKIRAAAAKERGQAGIVGPMPA